MFTLNVAALTHTVNVVLANGVRTDHVCLFVRALAVVPCVRVAA